MNGEYIDDGPAVTGPEGVYTPLDSLKEIVTVVSDLIDVVSERLTAVHTIDDDDDAFEILDSARRELVLALGRHIPGIEWNVVPHYTREAHKAANTFDDGTPVRQLVALENYGDEYTAYWSPRRDGPFEEFKARMLLAARRRTIHLVDDVDPALTDAVERAFTDEEGD